MKYIKMVSAKVREIKLSKYFKKLGFLAQLVFLSVSLLVIFLINGTIYKSATRSRGAGEVSGVTIPIKQFIMYQPPRWASNGTLLTSSEVAQRFGSLSYSHNGLSSNLSKYTQEGYQGNSTVYLIMDVIMGPSGLSSTSAQKTKCTSTQKSKSVVSNNVAMDTGDFCEIHDAIVSGTALPDYPDIYPTENWFLHKSDGSRLESVAGPDATYKTNPGDKNWQEYYARRSLRELAPVDANHLPISGANGLFIDNVQLNWGLILKSTNSQPPLEYSNTDDYAAAVVDFLKTVHTKLHSNSYNFPIWGNITPVTASRSWDSVAPYLEGAMQEIFLLSYSGGQSWGTGPADLTTSMQVLDRAENWMNSGRDFVAIAQGNSSGDYDKYVYSLLLLVTDGKHAHYKYRADSSSKYFEIPEFYDKLGMPTGKRQQVSTNPVIITRNFECGSVQVDLTNHSANIQTNTNCTTSAPTPTTAVSNSNATPTPITDTSCPDSMLSNQCFESGTTGWLFSRGNAVASFTTTTSNAYGGSGASGQITISQTGSNPQLYKKNFSLTSGQKYRLTFAARSNTGHDIAVHVLKHTSPYTNYGLNQRFDLTSSWQEFSIDFTAKNFSGTTTDTRIRFWTDPYDSNGDQFFVDNVSLMPVTETTVSAATPTTAIVNNTSTPTPTPALVSSSCPNSIFTNQCFENGTTSWLFNQGKAIASFTTTTSNAYGGGGASGQITITQSGSNPQLYRKGFALTSGQRYRLTFAARSNTGHDMSVHMIKHTSPYTNYGLSKRFYLTTSWQEFSVDFTAKNFSGTTTDVRFRFWTDPYDASGDQYFVDNVSLQKI